jgi:hypothetical protein
MILLSSKLTKAVSLGWTMRCRTQETANTRSRSRVVGRIGPALLTQPTLVSMELNRLLRDRQPFFPPAPDLDSPLPLPASTNPNSEMALCHRLQPRAFCFSAGECGGGTGRLRVAGQAEAASIPTSSPPFAEASSPLPCDRTAPRLARPRRASRLRCWRPRMPVRHQP